MRSNRRVLIHRRNGFTLTELLVSMAVLTVLAAMLFPVFRQAIESTKQSHCVQNFKQIGLALRMYQTDYDDRVPPVNYTDVRYGMEGDDRTWVQTLLPYVGHFAPFLCPADVGRHNQPLVPPDPGGPGSRPRETTSRRFGECGGTTSSSRASKIRARRCPIAACAGE
ncbi:MAG: type II secretion system protein [Armatimonadetes bacterium]|nr:type II secretion system protein [Armatimonadota bacterium]